MAGSVHFSVLMVLPESWIFLEQFLIKICPDLEFRNYGDYFRKGHAQFGCSLSPRVEGTTHQPWKVMCQENLDLRQQEKPWGHSAVGVYWAEWLTECLVRERVESMTITIIL